MAKVTSALAVAENSHLLESLEAGFALPSSWYTDEDLFALERERVLLRGWHYAAHTGQLGRAGDRVTLEVAGVPLVVVRNAADEIQGFVNVCRHRAHPVVAEDGNGSTLECRYDGWTYDLDGALQHMAGPEPEPRLDPAELGLIPVQAAVWGPAIWVNVEGSAPPFSEWTAGLSELVASHGLDVASHALAFEDTWSISANWKVFLDNAIECYHCPTCHPALSEVLEMDPALHQLHVGARHWIWHKVPLQQGALGPDMAMSTDPNGRRPGLLLLPLDLPHHLLPVRPVPGRGLRHRHDRRARRRRHRLSPPHLPPGRDERHRAGSAEAADRERPDHLGGRRHLRTRPARARGGFRSARQAASGQRMAAPALPAGRRRVHGGAAVSLCRRRPAASPGC